MGRGNPAHENSIETYVARILVDAERAHDGAI